MRAIVCELSTRLVSLASSVTSFAPFGGDAISSPSPRMGQGLMRPGLGGAGLGGAGLTAPWPARFGVRRPVRGLTRPMLDAGESVKNVVPALSSAAIRRAWNISSALSSPCAGELGLAVVVHRDPQREIHRERESVGKLPSKQRSHRPAPGGRGAGQSLSALSPRPPCHCVVSRPCVALQVIVEASRPSSARRDETICVHVYACACVHAYMSKHLSLHLSI
jgi:hypothetical protein